MLPRDRDWHRSPGQRMRAGWETGRVGASGLFPFLVLRGWRVHGFFGGCVRKLLVQQLKEVGTKVCCPGLPPPHPSAETPGRAGVFSWHSFTSFLAHSTGNKPIYTYTTSKKYCN